MANFLYHAAPHADVESMLTNGYIGRTFCLYASKNPYSWKTDDNTILQIDIRSLPNIRMSTFGEEDLDEILIWTDKIPPELISLYEER